MSDVELNQQAPLSLLSRICHVAREDARSAAESCSEAIVELQHLVRNHSDDAVLRINLSRPANAAFIRTDVDDALA